MPQQLPKLIGLKGAIGAGKDTVANYLVAHFGYTKRGFSDPVYESLYALNPPVIVGHHRVIHLQVLVDRHGWDFVKRTYPAVREWLRVVGTEAGRDVHGENCWVTVLDQRRHAGGDIRTAIRDVRFANEAQYILDNGGEIWEIQGRTSPEVASLKQHRSEGNLFPITRVLHNDSTLPLLYRRINAIFDTILGNETE